MKTINRFNIIIDSDCILSDEKLNEIAESMDSGNKINISQQVIITEMSIEISDDRIFKDYTIKATNMGDVEINV